jgi:hypothetical protein
LEAFLDRFANGSCNEAEAKVKISYDIFCIYKDKQGQEMCDKLYYAFNDKERSLNEWREMYSILVLNKKFSLDVLKLLNAHSSRKDVNFMPCFSSLETTLSSQFSVLSKENRQLKDIVKHTDEGIDQLHIKVDQLHIKVDQLQATLNQGFDEIKAKAREEFKSKPDELTQINKNINSINESINGLLQSSKDVDSKEGESIREFASQILELMQKGDYESLKRFIEKINDKEASIKEIIERSEASENEKADAMSKLSGFKRIQTIFEKKAKPIVGAVAINVLANLIAEIITALVPLLLLAVHGVK